MATALIDGSIVRRSRESTNSGSVTRVPDVKFVISTSSKEIAAAITIAPRIDGPISGSVMRRSTIDGVAPRSRAACSTAGS